MELYATLLRDNLGKKENQIIVMSTAMWHRHCCGEGDTHTHREEREERVKKKKKKEGMIDCAGQDQPPPSNIFTDTHKHTSCTSPTSTRVNRAITQDMTNTETRRQGVDITPPCIPISMMPPTLLDQRDGTKGGGFTKNKGCLDALTP